MARALFWGAVVVTALCLIWAGASTFKLFQAITHQPSTFEPESSAALAVPRGPTVLPREAYELFGAEAPAGTSQAAPETQLELKLLGTVVADDPQAGLAIIADEEGRQGYYAVDGELPGGAVLTEVRDTSVTLRYLGRLETLSLDRENTDAGRGIRVERPGTVATRSGAISPLNWEDAIASQTSLDPARLSQIRALPITEAGKPVGVRLIAGRNTQLYQKLGLRPSDVITSVNGIRLDDPSRAFELLKLLQSEQKFQVELKRDDRPMTLNIDADTLKQ